MEAYAESLWSTAWLVVVVNPSPPLWYNESARSWLFDAVDPDLIDWSDGSWNRGDFFRSRGVAVASSSEYEYEETFQFSNLEAARNYNGSGLALDEHGLPVLYPGYPPGDPYFTTLNGPRWREAITQGNVRRGGFYGDTASQDNIGSTLNKAAATWDDASNERFIDWLKFRCTEINCSASPSLKAVLASHTFNIRQHLSAVRAGAVIWNASLGCNTCKASDTCCSVSDLVKLERLVTEPVLHEYIRASYMFEAENWASVVLATKQAAQASLRTPPATYGNQWGLTAQYPLSMILSQISDAVWIENAAGGLPTSSMPKQAWSTLNYKLGHAAGAFKKSVFAVQYPNGHYDGLLWYAEASANGGLFEAMWGCSWTVPGKQYFGSADSFCAAHLEFAKFLTPLPHLFTDRHRCSEIGLLYSLPTVMWRRFSSLTFGTIAEAAGIPMLPIFSGMARLLEEHHFMYETLILGMPGLFEDSSQTSRFSEFGTLILPAIDALSDHHLSLLFQYVREDGGHLILVGAGVASLNEELRPRSPDAFQPLVEDPGRGKVSLIMNTTTWAYLAGGAQEEQQIVEVVRPSDPILKLTTSGSVWANVWQHASGPSTSVALVDYSFDSSCPHNSTACKNDVIVSLRVEGGHAEEWAATLYSPSFGKQQLVVTSSVDRISTTVPYLSYFAVVLFTQREGDLQCLHAASLARKAVQRCAIAVRLLSRSAEVELRLAIQNTTNETVRVLSVVQGRDSQPCSAGQAAYLGELTKDLLQLLSRVTAATAAYVGHFTKELQESPALLKLNAGSEMSGFKTLLSNETYAAGVQFGWERAVSQPIANDTSPDPPCSNPLVCSFAYGFTSCNPSCSGDEGTPPISNATLLLRLSPGKYVFSAVVIHWGGAAALTTAVTYVSSDEDAAIARRVRSGEPQLRVLEHTVPDGSNAPVRLHFSGSNVGTRWRLSKDNTRSQAGIVNGVGQWAGIGWLVNAIIVYNASAFLPRPVAAELAQHRALKAGALLDWALLGPLDDHNSSGLQRIFGPESDGNYSHTVSGESWRHCSADSCRRWGSALDIGSTLNTHADEGKAAFLQTYVHVEEQTSATLTGSTSGTGAFYLNGVKILPDESYVGLHEEECTVNVRLQAGWNRLLIKSLWHWGLGPDSTSIGWAAYAALLAASEPGKPVQPLPGVTVNACGPQSSSWCMHNYLDNINFEQSPFKVFV